MADEIIIRYKAVPDGFSEVNQAVNAVTNETKELQNQIKATFAEKSIDEATRALYEQGDVMGALITKYGDATKANKALQKELKTMAALGQQNTKEYKELAKAAAEMEDALGDTRNEVKRMASDTRLLDNVAQAGRGMAAAFSVAAGLSAALGKENENLQKTLAKVQGAMATLQGVQELANIATEKGGIVTQAYGAALTAVEFIQKRFAVSATLAWGAVTGGITLAVAAIGSLIYWMLKQEETEEEIAAKKRERDDWAKKEAEKSTVAFQNSIKERENYHKEQLALAKTEAERAAENVRYEKEMLSEAEARAKNLRMLSEGIRKDYGEESQQYIYMKNASLKADEELIDSRKRYADAIYEVRKQNALLAIEQLKQMEDGDPWLENELGITAQLGLEKLKQSFDENKIEEPLITDGAVDLTAVNAERMADLMAINLQLGVANYNSAKQQTLIDQQKYLAAQTQLEQQYVNSVQGLYSSMFSFISGIYANQLTESENSRQLELQQTGDDAKKREQIERKYAIEQAKIKRKAAAAERAAAVAGIAIDLAKTIQAITSQAAILSSNPVTSALAGNAYAQLGIAIATAAFQTAAILSKPLPEVPQFEKGGPVPLVGGRIDDGFLVGRSHREGGILINAQGGEYIWDREDVRQYGDIIRAANNGKLNEVIMQNYVAPLMGNAIMDLVANNAYDDYRLRNVIQQGQSKDRENAKYIAEKVSSAISQHSYNSQRYQ